MSRQRVLGATLVWLVVVASVSALVWVVISHAGDGLVASDQPLVTTRADSVAEPRTPSARPSRTPSRTPSPSPSGTPSGTGGTGGTPSGTPSATSSPSVAATPSASSPTPQPSPSSSPTSPSPSTATGERRTWQGQAGSIVVTCGGSGIRLVSAQPANGFRAEVNDEDEKLAVEFQGREDRAGTDVKVEARCVEGVPSFVVESDD